jgi:UDP-2-acetamido-2,6-beta-L-arabino-hexul-4-ose reductase
MTKVLVTGARGFIAKNLIAHLKERQDCDLLLCDRSTPSDGLADWLLDADVIYHLAGVNRPETEEEFKSGNTDFTKQICDVLMSRSKPAHVIMTSSIQAEKQNPYGISKLKAEQALLDLAENTDNTVRIFRLSNVFGKWCRPNYNSVTATFCHNIARGIPITISDEQVVMELVYIDDVIGALTEEWAFQSRGEGVESAGSMPLTKITLGDLSSRIMAFHAVRTTHNAPGFLSRFDQALYATYLSYLLPDQLDYGLTIRADERGQLAEFMRSEQFGQIFVSSSHPGVLRGNHYHHTKVEKFLVLTGEAAICLRSLNSSDIHKFTVSGQEYRVVDIPPGYTHSIENIGDSEMTVLFWASEPFDQDRPDTIFSPVDAAADTELDKN